jgi:hypothetical protein
MLVAHQIHRSSSDLLRIDRTRTAEIHPTNSYNPSPAKRLPMHPCLTVNLLRYPDLFSACRRIGFHVK